MDEILRKELRLLLLRYMTLEEGKEITRVARFATVRWANRCLEYNDIVGRWIDILALGGRTDERSDVVEEGKKGLVSESLEPVSHSHVDMLGSILVSSLELSCLYLRYSSS